MLSLTNELLPPIRGTAKSWVRFPRHETEEKYSNEPRHRRFPRWRRSCHDRNTFQLRRQNALTYFFGMMELDCKGCQDVSLPAIILISICFLTWNNCLRCSATKENPSALEQESRARTSCLQRMNILVCISGSMHHTVWSMIYFLALQLAFFNIHRPIRPL